MLIIDITQTRQLLIIKGYILVCEEERKGRSFIWDNLTVMSRNGKKRPSCFYFHKQYSSESQILFPLSFIGFKTSLFWYLFLVTLMFLVYLICHWTSNPWTSPCSRCTSVSQFASAYVCSSLMLPPVQLMTIVHGRDRTAWLKTTQRCGICCRMRRTGSAAA